MCRIELHGGDNQHNQLKEAPMTRKEQAILNKRKYKRHWRSSWGARYLHDPKKPNGVYGRLEELYSALDLKMKPNKINRVTNNEHQKIITSLKKQGVFTLRMTKEQVHFAIPQLKYKYYSYVFVKGKRFIKNTYTSDFCSSRAELLDSLNFHLEDGYDELTSLDQVVLLRE